jgi:predicted glutamine amidotransferase
VCRWLAYSGSPILLEEFLYKPERSLIDQSRHARMGAETTNGDGVGVGWYGTGVGPGLFHGVGPAWGDENLRELARHTESPLFLAHIRASTGTPVQQSNCHPFRHGDWLWVHNGAIHDLPKLRRDLVLAVDPDVYPEIKGSTDSEIMFFLALTFGLENDPSSAVEQMVGFVEETARSHGVENVMQMTIGTSDGERLWGFRYSTQRQSRTLFYSTKVETLRRLYPENPALQHVSEESRLLVSEPLGDLDGVWNEIPESSWGVVHKGVGEIHPFKPKVPAGR